MSFTIYQFCLLVSPDFVLNLVTMLSVIGFKVVALNLTHFHNGTFGMVGAIIYFMVLLYQRTLD
jgi:hypothetical protein